MKEEKQMFLSVDDVSEVQFGDVRENAVENGRLIKEAFKGSFDIVVKKGYCAGKCVVFANCDGLCNSQKIADNAMRPLLSFKGELPENDELNFICDHLLCGTEQKKETSLDMAVDMLLRGTLLIFIEGWKTCVIFGVQSIPERSIAEPDTDVQEFGSREGFTENIKTNLTLVRKRLCTANFTIQMQEIGKESKTRILLCYMKGRVDKDLLDEVKARLQNLQMDTVLGAGYLRKTLDTKRLSFFTMVGQTERPDTFASMLLEGRVGILVDGLPVGFVVPATLSRFMQVTEDTAQHFAVASMLVMLRYIALLAGLLLPGLYVAIAMYHQEMIPTELLTSVIDAKQKVPFSTSIEVIGMLIAFELLQEAGLRLPSPVGDTVSIIGALIVGQAAVDARVVSPIAVIIVAFSGISSYTLPSQDLASAVRLGRFAMVIAAALAGIFGVTALFLLGIHHLCTIESCGIAYMHPFVDGDGAAWLRTLLRRPLWKDSFRDKKIAGYDLRKQR